MNKRYCDEILENVTTFVTECIFVGYAIRERRGKQTIAFLVVLGYYLLRATKLSPKEHKKQICLWCSFVGHTDPPLFLQSQSLKLQKVHSEGSYTISIKHVLQKNEKV